MAPKKVPKRGRPADNIESARNFKLPREQREGGDGTTQTAQDKSTFQDQSTSKFHTLGAQSGYLDNMTITAENNALRGELLGMPHRDIPFVPFVEAAFPRIQHLDTLRRHYHLKEFNFHIDAYLMKLQTKLEGLDIQADLHTSFNELITFVIEKHYSRLRAILPEEMYKSPRARKPHIALVPYTSGYLKESSRLEWVNVQFAIYIAQASCQPVPTESETQNEIDPQHRSPPGGKARDREQLGALALETLSASALKQHTYCMLVDNNWVELWYFDRSGAIGSERIDIAGDAGRSGLLLALTAVALADKYELGYISADKFVCRHLADKDRTHFPQLGYDDFNLRLFSLTPISPLRSIPDLELKRVTRLNEKRGRGLVGRGTVVLSCQTDDFNDRNRVIVKYSWQPLLRRPEGEFYERVLNVGIQGIPRALGTGDVVNLCNGPRGRLHLILPSSSPVSTDDLDRVLRVIVFELKEDLILLEKLDFASKPYEFLRIFKSIVTIHRQLFTKAHILHRDINPNNLMFNFKEGCPGVVDQAWLIDLDFAIQVSDVEDDQEIDDSAYALVLDHQDVIHTLALPFRPLDFLPELSNLPPGSTKERCAVELARLARLPYFYRHDLECFYWTLWWIIARQTHYKRTVLPPELDNWLNEDLTYNRARKRDFAEREPTREPVILSIKRSMDKGHCRFVDDTLYGLSNVFAKGYASCDSGEDRTTAGGAITFDNFIQYLPSAAQ